MCEEPTVFEQALMFHSDIYKSLTGCRPHLDPDQWTLEQIEADIDLISRQLEEQLEWEKEESEFQAMMDREGARLKGMYVDNIIPGEI